jgi:L-aspartate oxidase
MKSGDLASAQRSHAAIIVGSGVAGLRAAIEAAEGGLSVALLAKDSAHDSNTDLAQGGVAVALSDEDQVGLHYDDTLAAGDGLCDEAAVAVMVGEGPRYITQLIEWGARFDQDGSRLAFTREAAHSARRILHAHGDATGREILRALWRKASALEGISFFPHTYSVDLILQGGACTGLLMLDETTGEVHRLEANAVVLATGGLGQIFRETTNPPQATGDGAAIAWRAGALLRDMEFVQFHPTSLHLAGAPRFLLSEALRGEGGLLRSADGRRFMLEVDPRGDLAPRDVVARAIFLEMQRTGADHVLLDMTHRSATDLERRFPRIYSTCRSYGIDLSRQPAPVAPAAHYVMGGVATDLWGRSTVPGLYAAGEVACTGVHGANRLASNSLLEGLVFGARTGQAVIEDRGSAAGASGRATASSHAPRCHAARAQEVIDQVKSSSWERLGIVRDGPGLEAVIASLDSLLASMTDSGDGAGAAPYSRPGLEAGNMATVASLVARSAVARQESRGAHYRADFPRRDDDRFGRSSFIGTGMARAIVTGALADLPR